MKIKTIISNTISFNFDSKRKSIDGSIVQAVVSQGRVQVDQPAVTSDDLYYTLPDTLAALSDELVDLLARAARAGLNITVENVPTCDAIGKKIMGLGTSAQEYTIRPDHNYVRAYYAELERLKLLEIQ